MKNLLSGIESLSDRDFDLFKKSVNTLLSNCYIIRGVEGHRIIYNFVSSNIAMFEAYLECAGWSLKVDETLGVICWQGGFANKVNLTIDETVSLFILRLIYEEKRHEISLGGYPVVSIRDFIEKSGILSKRSFKKTRFREIIRRFQSLKLLRLSGSDTDSETLLILYPSIVFACSARTIDDLAVKIESYNETVNEPEIDRSDPENEDDDMEKSN